MTPLRLIGPAIAWPRVRPRQIAGRLAEHLAGQGSRLLVWLLARPAEGSLARPFPPPSRSRSPSTSRPMFRPLEWPTVRPALWPAVVLALLAAFLLAGPVVAQDYLVQPGDRLQIEVIEDSSLNRTVLVAPDGQISVPLAGTVRAGGRTVSAVESVLTQALAPNFATEPTVSVSLSALAPEDPILPTVPEEPPTISIYVIGEVGSAGRLDLEPGTTLLQAFAQMGGFTPFAATRRIQLRRTDASGQETVYRLDYEAILDGRSPNATARLTEGDVIVVPERRLFE